LRASDIHLDQGIGGAIIFDQTNSNDAAMDKRSNQRLARTGKGSRERKRREVFGNKKL